MEQISKEDILIVGAGPCGLAAAIALQNAGFRPLIIEKGNIVEAIYRYPTHQTFFSTPDNLEIGGIPFVIEERKPKRNQALAYYREVTRKHRLRIHTYEQVDRVVKKEEGTFSVFSTTRDGQNRQYETTYVVLATGYYDHPNMMNIPGESLPKVFHYFKEAHPFFNQDVLVIGGRNSAVDAAMELEKAGARVTVVYRGTAYSSSIKPWILPEFKSLVRRGKVRMEFEAEVEEIKEREVIYRVKDEVKTIPNDFVFAMTGYRPDHSFLTAIGVQIDQETGRPWYNEDTMETNVPNLFIAGVLAAGNNANEIFIENGRFHGEKIAAHIERRERGRSGMNTGR